MKKEKERGKKRRGEDKAPGMVAWDVSVRFVGFIWCGGGHKTDKETERKKKGVKEKKKGWEKEQWEECSVETT